MASKKSAESTRGYELIVQYEWLRWMLIHLEMQTEQIDRQLLELEKCLPDEYKFSGDPPQDAEQHDGR